MNRKNIVSELSVEKKINCNSLMLIFFYFINERFDDTFETLHLAKPNLTTVKRPQQSGKTICSAVTLSEI